MNFVIVIQFLDYICKIVFKLLFVVDSLNDNFFHSIFTYFDILKTNNRDMLHLHCFLWFRETYLLTNFQNRIFTDSNYNIKVIWFIDQIIKNSIVSIAKSFVSFFDAISTNLNELLKEFIRKLHDNNNVVVFKKQIDSFLHNVTCLNYNAVFINKCRFNFFRVCVKRFIITKHDNTELYKNYVKINF